jgi:hypothetical protein
MEYTRSMQLELHYTINTQYFTENDRAIMTTTMVNVGVGMATATAYHGFQTMPRMLNFSFISFGFPREGRTEIIILIRKVPRDIQNESRHFNSKILANVTDTPSHICRTFQA